MVQVIISTGGLFVTFDDFPLKYYERLPGGQPMNKTTSHTRSWFFPGMYIGKNIQKLLRSIPFKEEGMALDYEECKFVVQQKVRNSLRLVRCTRKAHLCGSYACSYIPAPKPLFGFKIENSISSKSKARKLVLQRTAVLQQEKRERLEAWHLQRAIEAEKTHSSEKEKAPVSSHPETGE